MFCKRMDGILAPIKDSDTFYFIQKLRIKERFLNYWINLNNRADESKWVDGDNIETTFTKWAPHIPSDDPPGQHCAVMNVYRYFMWDDGHCDGKQYYICQYPDSMCQYRSNSHKFGQYCYELSTEFASFNQSLRNCEKNGGTLVNVKSEAIHQFLVELIYKERRWMNMSNKEVEAIVNETIKKRWLLNDWFGLRNDNVKWIFSDGEPLTSFSKWTHFTAGKGCASIQRAWDIASCGTQNGFICRYEISKNTQQKQVPPKWEITPGNVAVSVGQSVIVHCRATGDPQPTISWMRSLESKAQDRCFVDNTDIVNVFPNGSLYFRHIAKTDEGYYNCTANNGIGKPLSKAITIKVNTVPEFRIGKEEFSAKKGESITIPCKADGSMPMQYKWTVNKKSLEEWFGNDRMKFNIRNNETTKETVSELIIFRVEQNDSVTFDCTAENNIGKDVKLITLIVQDVPDSPELEKPILVVDQSVQLSWSLPFEGNSPIRQYFIQYKEENDNWNEHHASSLVVDSKRTSKLISNLQPTTSYVFRISAENAIGNSNYSREIFVKTEKIAAPEFRMRQEEILAKKGEHIRIPCEADGGMPMQYTWTVNKKSLEEWFDNGRMKLNVRNNETTKETVSELIIFSVEQKDSVTFYCTAENSLGKDVKRIRLVVQDVPDSPEFEKPILVVNQSVQLSWSLPFEGNSPIRQYFIQYKKENDTWNECHTCLLVVDSKRTSKLISDLQPATSYVFRIRAENTIGNSTYSREVFVMTEEIEFEDCSRIRITSTNLALLACIVLGAVICGIIFAVILRKCLRLIKQ